MRPYKIKPLGFGDLRTPEGRPYRYSVYCVYFGKLRTPEGRPYKMKPLAFVKLRAHIGRQFVNVRIRVRKQFTGLFAKCGFCLKC